MNTIFDILPDPQQDNSNFGALRVSLANPDLIRTSVKEGGWSWGEIRKPETINYRTFKPEPGWPKGRVNNLGKSDSRERLRSESQSDSLRLTKQTGEQCE